MRVGLVSCAKSKRAVPVRAEELYVSTLFTGLRRYALRHSDRWYILSAEHGLLSPDEVVAPYERTLNNMRKKDRLAWAERTRQQLIDVLPDDAEVILLAGARYRDGIEDYLRARGHVVLVPFEGLSLGRQLQALKEPNDC